MLHLRKRGVSHNAPIMLIASQLRAARALVGWSRKELANRSEVSINTIQDFEIGGSDPKQGTIQKWRRALEVAGVEFIDPTDDKGAGVRLRSPKGPKTKHVEEKTEKIRGKRAKAKS
jgi:transcriptional regulator with XRE-family HTH domain